jgi:hypothetical protein
LGLLESAKLDALKRRHANRVAVALRLRDLVARIYLVAPQALRDEACRRVRFFLP